MTFYDPEDAPRPIGPPKSELRSMLQQALVNTGGKIVDEPVPRPLDRQAEKPAPPMPSAHQIAVAIVEASRITGADPIKVATGEPNKGNGDYSLSRARTYAVLGMRAAFPGFTFLQVCRWCTASPASMQVTDGQRRKGALRWWDESAFQRVIDAAKAAPRVPA